MDMLKKVCAVVGGVLATFFRAYGVMIALVCIVVVIDFITGLIKAKATGEKWDSKKGTIGFWKKVALLVALAFGIFLDYFIPLALEAGLSITLPVATPFGLIISVYIALNESISICENLYQCNPKAVPGFLVKLLKIAGDQMDKGETGGGQK